MHYFSLVRKHHVRLLTLVQAIPWMRVPECASGDGRVRYSWYAKGSLRTRFAYPSRRFERPRRSPSSLTLRAMIGLGEDRCDPCLAGEPRTDANQSPSPGLPHSTHRQPRFVRDPEWLNWLYPCHVACLERSTERSNSTLNDCNRRYFRALQAMGDYTAVSEGKALVYWPSKS